MLFSGDWRKIIHEKNLKQKILWHCPFKKLHSYVLFDDTVTTPTISSELSSVKTQRPPFTWLFTCEEKKD